MPLLYGKVEETRMIRKFEINDPSRKSWIFPFGFLVRTIKSLPKLPVDGYFEASIWGIRWVHRIENCSPIADPSTYRKVALRGIDLGLRCPSEDLSRWVSMGKIRRGSSGRYSDSSEFFLNFKKFLFLVWFLFRALGTHRIFVQNRRFEHMYLRLRSLYRSDELNMTF